MRQHSNRWLSHLKKMLIIPNRLENYLRLSNHQGILPISPSSLVPCFPNFAQLDPRFCQSVTGSPGQRLKRQVAIEARLNCICSASAHSLCKPQTTLNWSNWSLDLPVGSLKKETWQALKHPNEIIGGFVRWENPRGFVTSSIAGECFWITALLIVE